MGFFTPSKRVSSREMRDVKSELRRKGFSNADLRNVDKMTSGHMGEEGIHKGMDIREIKKVVKDAEKHPLWHTWSPEQQKQFKESLEKRL